MRNSIFNSVRLSLTPLAGSDAVFMRELVNTDGWIKFIGQRNVHSDEDAIAYIDRITANPAIQYWVARKNDTGEALGIVTMIKRDYLDHHDIGFAFLPGNSGQGYAQEGAEALLAEIRKSGDHDRILATTLPSNVRSIRLLEKLGLKFLKEIEIEGETLLVYAIDL